MTATSAMSSASLSGSALVRDLEPDADEGLIAFSTKWCWQNVLRSCSRAKGADLPTRRQLARLLEVLHHASLKTEEGRYPKLAAMWSSRKPSRAIANVLEFDEPKRLNEPASTRPHDDLLKSASICESETVFLLVQPKERWGCDLVAWGFGDIRGSDGSHGKEIWEQLNVSQYPNDVLTVHFAGPGTFSIRHNGRFIAEYPETDDAEPVELWKDLRERFVLSSKPLDAARIYLLELVIGRLAASGRGGVLLCHGSAEVTHLDKGTPVKASSVDKQVRASLVTGGGNEIEPKAPYRFREIAQWISAIASVDGATEIARNLEIVRYGAKIRTKENYMEVIQNACESTTYEWLKSRGTRHWSAAYWVVAEDALSGSCRQVERPLALVVSADGDANAIFWEANQLRRLPIVYRGL